MRNTDASRPIVVGVEDKQHGALRYALDEAKRVGCGVRVIHAYAVPATGVGVFYGIDLARASQEGAEEILAGARDFVESTAPVASTEYAAKIGATTRVLEYESTQARSIVLGPDDNTWYDRILIGDVGSWLVTHADCPVIVVPAHWSPQETRRTGIVVTIDGATNAHGPLTFAFAAAERGNEDLYVIHVVPTGTSSSDEEEIQANIAEVLAGWSEKYPTVKVIRSLVFGEVGDVFIDTTRLASLVVVGRPHGHGQPFLLARPVAVSVIREANCPVAVVPPNHDG